MITSSLLSILAWPCHQPESLALQIQSAAEDPELEAKIAAAGTDVAKLTELANSYASSGQDSAAKKVCKKILEIDANHEAAHKLLGHQLYDKKWFESFAELSKYKREEAAKMKAKGLMRFKDEWVAEGDLPFMNMGWTKDAEGAWVNPIDLERAKQAAEWKAAGHEFRPDDNSWVAPADREKWVALQWKCGDAWLDMAAANVYHAKPEQAWELVGEHFVVESTTEWEAGNIARWHADKCHAELVRLFGIEPKKKSRLVVLNSLAQYNLVAGNPPVLPEFDGFSSLHGAYFADLAFDGSVKPAQFAGCGVSYWDRKDAKTSGWGPLWLRWAAAQSFVDAIDPSWSAIGARVAGAAADDAAFAAAFWSEKKIPRWLRYGAASYVERFLKSPEAAEGDDPWALREFACAEIKKAGGLHKLDEIFAFALSLQDVPGSSRLYAEAGLLVAFLLDGAADEKDLLKKHEAFKAALKSGPKADVTTAVTALQKALDKNEREIKKFAGL